MISLKLVGSYLIDCVRKSHLVVDVVGVYEYLGGDPSEDTRQISTIQGKLVALLAQHKPALFHIKGQTAQAATGLILLQANPSSPNPLSHTATNSNPTTSTSACTGSGTGSGTKSNTQEVMGSLSPGNGSVVKSQPQSSENEACQVPHLLIGTTLSGGQELQIALYLQSVFCEESYMSFEHWKEAAAQTDSRDPKLRALLKLLRMWRYSTQL